MTPGRPLPGPRQGTFSGLCWGVQKRAPTNEKDFLARMGCWAQAARRLCDAPLAYNEISSA